MLLTPEQFAGFLSAALLITLSPGPDNLMILSIGLSRGRQQGMAFGMGCALGCLSHTFLTATGISALIAGSPFAFGALKIAGGLYLTYLGIQILRGCAQDTPANFPTSLPDESLLKLFSRGLIANSINPKVILFFLAFLPQFIYPENGQPGWQMSLLGLTFTAQAIVLFGLLGFFSGSAGRWLTQNPKVTFWLNIAAGSIFIWLGLRFLLF